jgi:hypothetical protein
MEILGWEVLYGRVVLATFLRQTRAQGAAKTAKTERTVVLLFIQPPSVEPPMIITDPSSRRVAELYHLALAKSHLVWGFKDVAFPIITRIEHANCLQTIEIPKVGRACAVFLRQDSLQC